MFNAGRILRNLNKRDSIAPRSTFASTSRAKKKKKPKRRFRCYVPFVWQAMAAACAGLVVVVAGAGLCVVGYYADQKRISLPQRLDDDVTPASAEGEAEGEEARQLNGVFSRWKAMIYVGPALMSCGCFAVVFSCVVVCELRDKMLEIMDEREEGVGLDPNVQQLRLDFFQSVVYPQHNKHRSAQEQTHSAPDGGQPSSGAVAEVSQTQQPRVMTNKEQRDNCTGLDTDLCRRLYVKVSDASAAVGSNERQPGLLLANSGDEVDSCDGRTKRVRYSSDPTTQVQWVTAAQPRRGTVPVATTTAPMPPIVVRTQGQCAEKAGQLFVTRVANLEGQRVSCQRTANVRRLLVRRREPDAGERKTSYQTNSIEVLFNSAEVPELVFTCEWRGSVDARATAHGPPDRDRSFSCSTPPTNSASPSSSSSAPSGNHFTQLRHRANILVHRAYVHADPEKGGHPITALLPSNIQLPQLIASDQALLPVMSAPTTSSITSPTDKRVLPIKTPFSVSSVSFRSPSSLGMPHAASQFSHAHISTPKRSSPQSPNIETPSHLHSIHVPVNSHVM